MAIPIFFQIAFATQAFPVAAILAVRGRHPPEPYRGIAVWCCLLMMSDMVGRILTLINGSNLSAGYAALLIEAAMTLWILAPWQPGRTLRITYRAGVPAIGLILVVLLLRGDFSRAYDGWLGPFVGLVVLVAVLQTLLHRTLLSRELLTEQDWFWICLGLSLFWFSNAPLPPFLNGYVVSHEDWVWRLLYVRAGLLMVAFSLMTWGVLCTRKRPLFSGHS